MLEIFIDADGCPVKGETYRVAQRHGLVVWVVANHYLQTPRRKDIRLVVVKSGPDEADDWIAERAGPGDIVVTANADINPIADEVCDGVDNDCDIIADGPDAVDAEMWFVDADGDGFGARARAWLSGQRSPSHR